MKNTFYSWFSKDPYTLTGYSGQWIYKDPHGGRWELTRTRKHGRKWGLYKRTIGPDIKTSCQLICKRWNLNECLEVLGQHLKKDLFTNDNSKYLVYYAENGVLKVFETARYITAVNFAEDLTKQENIHRVSIVAADVDFCRGHLVKKYY